MVLLVSNIAQAAVPGGAPQECFAKDATLSSMEISDKFIIDEIRVLWNNRHTARITFERDGKISRLPNSRQEEG